MYMIAWSTTAYVIAEAQIQVWEECGEDMEMEFWLASKTIWQTIQLGKRKPDLSQDVLVLGVEMLTLTENIVDSGRNILSVFNIRSPCSTRRKTSPLPHKKLLQ